MRPTLLALTLGIVLGVLGTLAAVEVAGGWWEYRMADGGAEVYDMVNARRGWHVVPNQPNPLHLRRSRFAHR